VVSKGWVSRYSPVIRYSGYSLFPDNVQACGRFVYFATRILRKWLNRKSQRKAYNWDRYNQALAAVRWPRARILKDLNPCRRAQPC